MTEKHVRDMSPEESAELLSTLKRGLPPVLPPLDTTLQAKDMSEAQRRAFLAEAARRAR
jgi:hypothetical protein